MKQKFLGLIFLLSTSFFLEACSKQRVVAQVGSVSVRQGQQELRLKMAQELNPGTTAEMALNQLIHAAKLSQALDQLGVITTEVEIDSKFENLKQQATKNEAIARLLKKFGSHKEFKSLYVKPLIIGEKIASAGFLKDTAFQSSQMGVLEKVLSESLSDPSALEELSQKYQVSLYKGQVDVRGSGLTWMSLREVASPYSLPSGLGIARKWYHDFLKDTGNGQMVSRVEPVGDYFLVIRKDYPLEKSPEAFQLTAAAIQKKSFSEWLNTKLAPIKVERFVSN